MIAYPRIVAKSALGSAVSYALNQWLKLLTYLKDGRLENNNNRTERAVYSGTARTPNLGNYVFIYSLVFFGHVQQKLPWQLRHHLMRQGNQRNQQYGSLY